MTWQTKADAPSPLAGGGGLSWLSGLPEWLRSNLFRQSSGAAADGSELKYIVT